MKAIMIKMDSSSCPKVISLIHMGITLMSRAMMVMEVTMMMMATMYQVMNTKKNTTRSMT
jgi:hypothetical protein